MAFNIKQKPIWLKVTLGVLGFVLIVGLTVGALVVFLPKSSENAKDDTVVSKVESAAKLVESYDQSTDILDRADLYKELTNESSEVGTTPTAASITYKSSDKPYGLVLASLSFAQYQQIDAQTVANSDNLIVSTEKFLSDNGVLKISTETIDFYTYSVFEDPKVVCQTDNRRAINEQPASYSLTCLDKSDIDTAYKDYESLLGLAGSAFSTDSVKTIQRNDIIEDNKKLTTLVAVNSSQISTSLYFLQVDDKQTYLGQRTTPSVDNESSFALPTELEAAVDGSTEKDFLAKYIN